jgi:hypothetical protein
MRKLPFVAMVFLFGCDLYVEPDPGPVPDPVESYTLVPRGNVAVLGPVTAVAWDGSRHWIVTRTDDGGYWDPDRIEIFRYDVATGERSEPIVLTSHWERPTGAAWLQGQLWIHYDANNSGLVTSLDTATGVETPRFNVSIGMNDIDTDGELLYFAQTDVSGVIEVRDPADGEILDVLWSEAFQASLRGLGVVRVPGAPAPEVWGGTLSSNALAVMVGDQTVATAALPGFGTNLFGLIQFAGQQLTFVENNQLYFFDVVRP